MASPFQHIDIPDFYFEFPQSIGLELSSHCPLACVMCPQPQLKRANREIPTEAALRVIDELAEFPDSLLEPQGMGEMFIHPEWPKILRHAVVEKGITVAILTHGAFLTDEVIDELLSIGPAHMILGIEGATKAVHEAVALRSNFEKVVASAKRLIARRAELGVTKPGLHIRMTPSELNAHEAEAFLAFWQPLIAEGDTVQINPVCNTWTGTLPYIGVDPDAAHVPSPRFPCPQLWMTANVLEDGRVSPCCLDNEGEIEIGNVNEDSLQNIWKGETLAGYRQAHLEGRYHDVPVCGDCPDWPNYVRTVLGNDWGRPARGADGEVIEAEQSQG